jgi:hypothetical protein
MVLLSGSVFMGKSIQIADNLNAFGAKRRALVQHTQFCIKIAPGCRNAKNRAFRFNSSVRPMAALRDFGL